MPGSSKWTDLQFTEWWYSVTLTVEVLVACVTELGTSVAAAAAPAGPDARLHGRRLGSAMKPMKSR